MAARRKWQGCAFEAKHLLRVLVEKHAAGIVSAPNTFCHLYNRKLRRARHFLPLIQPQTSQSQAAAMLACVKMPLETPKSRGHENPAWSLYRLCLHQTPKDPRATPKTEDPTNILLLEVLPLCWVLRSETTYPCPSAAGATHHVGVAGVLEVVVQELGSTVLECFRQGTK